VSYKLTCTLLSGSLSHIEPGFKDGKYSEEVKTKLLEDFQKIKSFVEKRKSNETCFF